MDMATATQPPQLRQCAYVSPDGFRCKAVPLSGKELCFFHDPESAELRRRAGVAGGRARARKVLAEAKLSRLDSRESLIDLLSETVQQVRTGQIDPKVANAIGYLVNVARQILESDEYERLAREIEALKQQLGLGHECLRVT